ncbi:MAG: response regulator [Pseudomarimonas sp.]
MRPVLSELPAAPDHRLLLIVDDHLINRVVLQRQLRVLGYHADTAEHGEQALLAMQRRHYSVLITDCNMPVLNGYELSRQVRSLEAASGSPRLPIIAFTASEQAGEAELCSAAGMDGRLEKPTDLSALRQLIEHWLPTSERQSTLQATPASVPTPAIDGPPMVRERDLSALDHAVLDSNVLQRLTGGDAVANRRALALFHRVNSQDVSGLWQAITAGNATAIMHAAHRIKGASRLVGASAFAQICAELEAAAHTYDADRVSALLPRFHLELKRLNDYLNQLAI